MRKFQVPCFQRLAASSSSSVLTSQQRCGGEKRFPNRTQYDCNEVTKQILAMPTVIEGPHTVINFLATMKRERQAHRFMHSGSAATFNTETFMAHLSLADTKHWLSFESALAVVSACASSTYQGTISSPAVHAALAFLSHMRQEKLSTITSSVQNTCRMIIAMSALLARVEQRQASSASVLVREYLAYFAPADLATSFDIANKRGSSAPLTMVEATLIVSATSKLAAINHKGVQKEFSSVGINASTLAALVSTVDASLIARDQLASFVANVVSEATLRCFVVDHQQTEEFDVLVASINKILCKLVDQSGRCYGKKIPLKSHNIVVLLSTISKLCSARRTADQQVTSSLRPTPNLSMLSKSLSNNHSVENRHHPLGELGARRGPAEMFLTSATVEYLIKAAEGCWIHFTFGEVALTISSLASICQVLLWSRVEEPILEVSVPIARAAVAASETSPSPKPSRFSKKQRVDATATLSNGPKQLATSPPQHSSSPFHANSSGDEWFFLPSQNADEVEWEGRITSFVDFATSSLQDVLSKRGTLAQGHDAQLSLKELTMFRQALTHFGRSSPQLDHRLVRTLEQWQEKLSPQQYMRAIAAIANAPHADAEHGVSRVLHCLSAQLRGKELKAPPHEVIEFLHAIICQGGLRRGHGLHVDVVVATLTHVLATSSPAASESSARDSHSSRLESVYQMMMLECSLQYVQGWHIASPPSKQDEGLLMMLGRLISTALSMLRVQHPLLFASDDSLMKDNDGRFRLSSKELKLLPSLSVTLANFQIAKNPIVTGYLFDSFGHAAIKLEEVAKRINMLTPQYMLRCDVGCISQLLCGVISRRATSNDLVGHRNGMIRWFTTHVLRTPIAVKRYLTASREGRFSAALLAIAAAGDEQLREVDQDAQNSLSVAAVPAELWSNTLSSVRTFNQLDTLATVYQEFVPESVSSAAQLSSLVSRKGEQLMARTGTYASVVSLLGRVGHSEDVSRALLKLLERDLPALTDKTSTTFVSPNGLLTALESVHPAVKPKMLAVMVPVTCVALMSSQILDDVFRLLLLFAPVVAPEDLVTLARYVPFHLADNPCGAPQPQTFLNLLHFFRVGKQPRSVQHLRGLFGSFLAGHQLGDNICIEDVLRIVDVPESSRVGSYWRISHRTLFKRVRRELGLDASHQRPHSSGDIESKAVTMLATRDSPSYDQLSAVLAPLGVGHWILALTFDQMFFDNVIFDDDLQSRSNQPQSVVYGHEMLARMLCQAPLREYLIYDVMTKKLSVAECTQLVRQLIQHWEVIPLRPRVTYVDLPTTRPLMSEERSTLLRWIEAWSTETDTGDTIPIAEHEMFRLLADPCLRRIFPKMEDHDDDGTAITTFEGAAMAEVLAWGPREWNDMRVLDRVEHRATALRTKLGTSTICALRIVCVGVDKLVSWCRTHYTSLKEEIAWLQSNEATSSDRLLGDVTVVLSIVESSLWLQWHVLENERQQSMGTSSKSLCDLTAASACALWLDLYWWLSLQWQPHNTQPTQRVGEQGDRGWCLGLQKMLMDTIFRLLQSADGSVLAHIVTVLIPNEHSGKRISLDASVVLESSERVDFDLAAQRILGRISMLLGTDLDNFSLEDVMLMTPRLAQSGFLTHTTMSTLKRNCISAIQAKDASIGAGDDGAAAADALQQTWQPAKRKASGPVSLDAVLSMLDATSHLAERVSFEEDDV